MTSLFHILRNSLARLLPVLALTAALCICLALPALAHENGGGEGGEGGGGSEGNAAEASEAAADAKDAVAAAEEAMSIAGRVGTAGVVGTVQLSSPGQGVTASSGGATEGISAMDRAALDALNVNPSAWSPF